MDSNHAPDEGPPELLEGAQTWVTESPCHMGEGSTEKTSLVPMIGGAEAKTGSSPPQGFASTVTIVLLVGSYPDVYKPAWRLTAQDLVSDHDNALEWCRYAFPPATTEFLTVLSDEHMDDGLRYADAQLLSRGR